MGLYRDNGTGNGNYYFGFRVTGLKFRDRIWCIWGSYYNIPKAIFYLLKGDDKVCQLREPKAGKPMIADSGLGAVMLANVYQDPPCTLT